MKGFNSEDVQSLQRRQLDAIALATNSMAGNTPQTSKAVFSQVLTAALWATGCTLSKLKAVYSQVLTAAL